MRVTSLTLTSDRDVAISLDADGKHSSLVVPASGKHLHEARLVLAASAAIPDSPQIGSALVLLRIESADGHVGAPSIFPIPAGVKLSEFFTTSISSGTYALGEKLELGTLNSKPIILTVSSSPK